MEEDTETRSVSPAVTPAGGNGSSQGAWGPEVPRQSWEQPVGQPGTVPDERGEGVPSPPESARRWRPPRWLKILGGITFFVAVVVIVGSTVRLDYYSLGPGDSYETSRMISIEGAPTFDHSGSLYMTTVSVTPVTLIEWAATRLDDDTVLVPADQIDGGKSSEEVDEVNAALMSASKLNAEAVAFQELGIPVEFTGSGALVVEVSEDAPAAQLLEVGDVIEAVDGKPVTVVTDLTDILSAYPPGDVVTLTVKRDDKDVTVDVPLVANPKDPAKSMIGIVVQTADFGVESPVKVNIDSREVGGPSAGLVYTLTIIDELSEKDLTKGRRVAATGEMNLDGTVSPIGGVEQKVRSVEGVGADVFLVPDGNCEAATAKAESVEVVCVSDIDDALAALDELPAG